MGGGGGGVLDAGSYSTLSPLFKVLVEMSVHHPPHGASFSLTCTYASCRICYRHFNSFILINVTDYLVTRLLRSLLF